MLLHKMRRDIREKATRALGSMPRARQADPDESPLVRDVNAASGLTVGLVATGDAGALAYSDYSFHIYTVLSLSQIVKLGLSARRGILLECEFVDIIVRKLRPTEGAAAWP